MHTEVGDALHQPLARVLVVDDERGVRLGVCAALRGMGYVAVEAAGCGDAIRAVGQHRFDLALVDIGLPDGDGVELASRLRAGGSLAVMFLTAAHELSDLLTGFDAGADDYVVKPFAMAELLVRVAAVLRRTGGTQGRWVVQDLVVDESTFHAERGGVAIALTATEFRLLNVFLRNRSRTLSKRQLLALAWDSSDYDPNVVERHVSALRRKLEAHGPRLIHTVHGFGYTLRT